MSKPITTYHDAITGETVNREMNDDEFAEWQAIAAQYPSAEEAPTE